MLPTARPGPRLRINALIAAASAAALLASGGFAAAAATSDSSPVNLSNAINMAAGKAASQATVTSGGARFEVLTPEVVRMEYSPSGTFLDVPTFDVLDRNFAVPAYTSSVQNGWLTITTSQMTLKYQVGSGPFSTANTRMQLLGALPPGASANVTPAWSGECTFGQACQAGAAALAGGASIANDHLNYLSPPGFVAGLTATWTVAANHTLQVLGKCLDVNGGTANGTVVDLYDCNSTGAQTWLPQPGGALVNPQSGKCLADSSSGTQAVINDGDGAADQRWVLP